MTRIIKILKFIANCIELKKDYFDGYYFYRDFDDKVKEIEEKYLNKAEDVESDMNSNEEISFIFEIPEFFDLLFSKLDGLSLVNFALAYPRYLDKLTEYFQSFDVFTNLLSLDDLLVFASFLNKNLKNMKLNRDICYDCEKFEKLFKSVASLSSLEIYSIKHDQRNISCIFNQVCAHLKNLTSLVCYNKEFANEDLYIITDNLKKLNSLKIYVIPSSKIQNGLRYFLLNVSHLVSLSLNADDNFSTEEIFSILADRHRTSLKKLSIYLDRYCT